MKPASHDDFAKVAFPYFSACRKRLAYFAVFDGHNGTRASQLAAAELHKHVATKLGNCEPEKLEREFKKRVVEAFREFDDAFLKQASKQYVLT